MLRVAGKWLLLGVLLVSMGGHLALLQTIAWSNMLVEFSAGSSLGEAVEKTFDGEHPCELCKVVEKSKDGEKEKPALKAGMKMEIALPAPVKVPFPRCTGLVATRWMYDPAHATVYLAVPVRPPRVG